MKKYLVTLYYYASMDVEVNAKNENDAIKKAWKKADKNLDELNIEPDYGTEPNVEEL